MAHVITDTINYENIAKAIREKLERKTIYYPSQMAEAVRSINMEPQLLHLKIDQNGVYVPFDQYNGFSAVTVEFNPLTYSLYASYNDIYKATDEGYEGYGT